MAILPGYEYDIFISYRHNDNRSGWVTDFVNALQEELAATIKEPLSIYFDKNPHDGIHELHDVDGSLKEKIKCLIFIPILSRTYCDPKGFAWQHEFLSFLGFTLDDAFGIKVKLGNGNVARRVLPARIHDLSAEDTALFEKETGGPIRAIEFVFKSVGVNRPLLLTDKREENLAHTVYRDQVNKMANVIGDIITAMKKPVQANSSHLQEKQESPRTTFSKFSTKKIFLSALGVLIVATVLWFGKNLLNNQSAVDIPDKSIAVLPFTDISDDKDQAYFSDGMMVEILDHLFKIKDLRIIPRNSTLGYKESTKPPKMIAQELGVVHLIQGSVRKFGNRIKISVQLTNGLTEQNLWQETYEEDITDVSRLFSIQSSVAQKIASELKVRITPEVKKRIEAVPTQNQVAYDLYLKGTEEASGFWSDGNTSHVRAGIAYLNKAILLDSTFSDAFIALGHCYWQLAEYAPDYSPGYYRQSREYLNKAIALDPQNGRAYSTLAVNQYHYDWDRKAASRSLKKAKELNPSDNEITMIQFWFYLHTQHCDSMKVMLDKIKETTSGDFYYSEVQLAICRGQYEELNAFNPPEDPSNWVGQFFEQQRLMILGRFDDALAKMELYKTLASEQIYLEMKGELLGMTGRKSEALQVIQELETLSKTQHVWPSRFAVIYMAIGDEKKAYEYLEKGLAYRGLWLHFVPYYAPFYKKRNDPKFQAFMKRTWVN